MLPENLQWIVREFEPEGDAWLLFEIARNLEREGNLEGAATIYDRAFGLEPSVPEIREARQKVLDRLVVVEHDIVFRYIPGGSFLMGWDQGEADERPWHPVWLSPFWMSETPISWAAYCRLMDWTPPPDGFPRDLEDLPAGTHDPPRFHLHEANKLRLQYCEDHCLRAQGWHTHVPPQLWQTWGNAGTAQDAFGAPPRSEPDALWEYSTKPMIGISWSEAMELADRLSTPQVRYRLPTEAQWEKAARGGLIGARRAWGDEKPTEENCDFDRFRQFSILPMKTFPSNGYGLYAMNGCVWEWTRDWYDRDFYRQSPEVDPQGPDKGEEKVLRGGSWADCADVVTVSYRMSRSSGSWRQGEWGDHETPNIGFRLCRILTPLS